MQWRRQLQPLLRAVRRTQLEVFITCLYVTQAVGRVCEGAPSELEASAAAAEGLPAPAPPAVGLRASLRRRAGRHVFPGFEGVEHFGKAALAASAAGEVEEARVRADGEEAAREQKPKNFMFSKMYVSGQSSWWTEGMRAHVRTCPNKNPLSCSV